jgi:hypothetical protein
MHRSGAQLLTGYVHSVVTRCGGVLSDRGRLDGTPVCRCALLTEGPVVRENVNVIEYEGREPA